MQISLFIEQINSTLEKCKYLVSFMNFKDRKYDRVFITSNQKNRVINTVPSLFGFHEFFLFFITRSTKMVR